MQKYKYTAVNLQNQKLKGTFIANDEKDLGVQLAKQGLYLVSATPYTGKVPSSFFTLGTGKVTLNELTTFCRQFSIMQNTHIPILESLDILRNQHFSSYFRKILQVVYEDVKSGVVLSTALEKHDKIFPDFFRSMIYVGEMSGKLDIVLNSLAEYYEKDTSLKRKAKSAMSYPAMLMLMMGAIVILMLLFVVPTFRDALSSLDVEIEGFTKVVYDISDFLLLNWQYMLLGVLFLALMIFIVSLTEKGHYILDVVKVKTPFVRGIQKDILTARFARAFGLLLSSGMDMNEAMNVVQIVIGNRYIKKKFLRAAENVRHGMSLTVAFENEKIFPQMMIQMISIGETSASLDEILTRSCIFFDTQVEASLNSLTSKLQPVMMIVMGLIVAALFIAVYSPMLSIMTNLNA